MNATQTQPREGFVLCRPDMNEGGATEQEQAGDQQAILQLGPVPQPQIEQPVASQFQEAEEATGTAADSTTEAAACSSDGGGGYMSVPPSSLWGPPAEAGFTSSSAESVETGSAGEPAPGADHTAQAGSAYAADDAPVSAGVSPMDDQVACGRPSNWPATAAGFATGMHSI